MTVPTEVTPGATRLRSALHVAPPSLECERFNAGRPLGERGGSPPLVLTVRSKNRLPLLSARSVPSFGISWMTFQVAPSSRLALRNVLLLQVMITTSVPSGSGWTVAPALEDCPAHSGYGAR